LNEEEKKKLEEAEQGRTTSGGQHK
jgi:hypothetical protein